MANLLKGKGAKLQGLQDLVYGRQLSKEFVLFHPTLYQNDLALIRRLFLCFGIKEGGLKKLERTSGIYVYEVAILLSKIRGYHQGLYRHSYNVAWLSASLSFKLGLSEQEVCLNLIGALFHDLGKISLPHCILDKPSKLNDKEWGLIKEHPKIGVALVSYYDWAQQLESMIMLHHERLDGQGYYLIPGKQIPLSARIISMADAFDAMRSPRPYQEQQNIRACCEEIMKCSGTQFDPQLLPALNATVLALQSRFK